MYRKVKTKTPRVITIANGIRNTDNNSDDVYDQKYRRRNQQSRPFEDVKLRERSIVCCFDVSVKLVLTPARTLGKP